jgi:ACT domain-containing protein
MDMSEEGKRMADSEFFLVKSDMLPEVFIKVMAVKRLINSGKADSVNDDQWAG